MIAVLADAIDCVEHYRSVRGHHNRQLFSDATHWILSEDNTWLYSFERICETLGLDAQAVRYGLHMTSGRRRALGPHVEWTTDTEAVVWNGRSK